MMNRIPYKLAATSLLLVATVGCASIMGNPIHLMPISSSPSDASIVITDETGKEIFKGTTPTTVSMEKSTGKYFGKKSYTVKISKAGFVDQSIAVTASANGWYIGGNLVFGGLIGWLIVDPQNGKMYNLSPENISPTLQPNAAPATLENPKTSLNVIPLQNVPSELREKMVLVSSN
jgi:hypothetical protein